MIKICVSGSKGKMGSRIIDLAKDDADLQVCGEFDVVEENPEQFIEGCDCLIEFTTPKATIEHLDLCIKLKKAMVIGTTGLSDADKDKIKEVLEMLMRNSLLATEKGYIAISVIQTKDGIECSISDTGTVIPKESINDVFDRFSGFSRIPSQEGSWIDPCFYILKQIIEKHGGRVDIESEPNKITKFTLKLSKAVTP